MNLDCPGTPLLLLNSALALQYLAAYGYYPCFEFRPQKLPFGTPSRPPTALELFPIVAPLNRFFLLEHLLQHFVPTSLIWLHDGIWISPAPARHIIDTANRLATSQSQISDAPLHLSCTPLATLGREVLQRTLHGAPPPPSDPYIFFRPPRQLLIPPLTETDAKRAFVRM